jgi:hypothetical protein
MSRILSIVYLYCFAVNLHSGSSRILLAPARQMVKAIGLYPFTDISNTLRLIAALAFFGLSLFYLCNTIVCFRSQHAWKIYKLFFAKCSGVECTIDAKDQIICSSRLMDVMFFMLASMVCLITGIAVL